MVSVVSIITEKFHCNAILPHTSCPNVESFSRPLYKGLLENRKAEENNVNTGKQLKTLYPYRNLLQVLLQSST